MRDRFHKENDPDLIRAAEQAYRDARPEHRGRYDAGAGRREQVLRSAAAQQTGDRAA